LLQFFNMTEETKKISPYQVTENVARARKYVLFQDYYHLDEANFVYAFSKENLDALHSAGKKHFVVENLSIDQSLIDNLANGKISKKDFVQELNKLNHEFQTDAERQQTHNAMADGILYAKELGIKFHALDELTPLSIFMQVITNPEGRQAVRDQTNTVQDHEPLLVGHVINVLISTDKSNEYVDKIYDSIEKLGITLDDEVESKDLVNKVAAATITERIDADKDLAARIVKATNNEGAAIFFGAGHGNWRDGKRNGKDLDEWLGDVGKIGLSPTKAGYDQLQKKMSEAPDYLIITDSKNDGSNIPQVSDLKNNGAKSPNKAAAPKKKTASNENGQQLEKLIAENALGLGGKIAGTEYNTPTPPNAGIKQQGPFLA
jgi:hypothetical protein